MLRSIRWGAVRRMALLWGMGWVLLSLTLDFIFRTFVFRHAVPMNWDLFEQILIHIVRKFVMGALAGAAFSLLFAAIGRGLSVKTVPAWRVMFAGALGLGAVAFLTYFTPRMLAITGIVPILTLCGVFAGIGGVVAGTLLVIARRGELVASRTPSLDALHNDPPAIRGV